jgi:chitinase
MQIRRASALPVSLLATALVGATLACVPAAEEGATKGGASGSGKGGAGGRAGSGGRGPSGSGGSSSAGAGGSSGPSAGGSGAGGSSAPGSGGSGAGGSSAPRTDAGPAPETAAGDSQPAVEIGPPAPPPPPFKNNGIVVYWGQNGYSRASTDLTKHEKDLATTCKENPSYEAIVIGFIIDFKSPENADGTPRTNFSKHCNSKMAYDAQHPRLYKCDDIARGINECQRLGKKVLISHGGANGSYGFPNDETARTYAQTAWDLFLGGKHTHRPFSTAVLDGVDLDIEGGSSTGYSAFVRRMRELMNADKSRRWYITGAPQCIFPDAYMGPAPGRMLGEVPNLFDYLFVQFYNNSCGGHNPDIMVSTFNQWARVGPKIMVGLPAALGAGGGFVDRNAVGSLLNRVKGNPAFGGVMLWDASYDQNNIVGGKSYGSFVKGLLP